MRSHFFATATLALLATAPAAAADWSDWSISPWTGMVGDLNYSVGGQIQGTVFDAAMPLPAGSNGGGTGAATLNASLERDYDSGLALSLKGTFELFHDRLSGDNYGSDLLAKLYGVVQTGLGRVEIGMSDGAAYQLAIIGPTVNGEASIDNPNATFFRDPSTGAAFINVFTLNSAVESSLNYAKVSYFTPRLFGVQIGLSFTPSEGKYVLPFLNNGPNVPNRQKSMWEGAINYSDSFGPLTLSASAGFTFGHGEHKTPGHAGLTDWGTGAQLDWDINDDTKLSLGGAYREANTYTFDINNAFTAGATRSMHGSVVLTRGSWSFGTEIGHGSADGSLGAPDLGIHAYQFDLGYQVNSNLQLTGGWQHLIYTRDAGTFYNGATNRIGMHAVFAHAVINI